MLDDAKYLLYEIIDKFGFSSEVTIKASELVDELITKHISEELN